LRALLGHDGRPDKADYCVDIESLPLVLGMPEPIAPHCPAPWERPKNAMPRIGVCWQGASQHLNDRDRSCPFDPRPRLASKQWDLVSLQVGHGFQPKDYGATAAVLRGLAAVVSVDTSAVHVAGTLGVPTVLIPPAAPEWRWGVTGETTAWYPSVRVVRRRDVFDWGHAWAQATTTLEGML
jgi:hypothetical protein